MILWDSTCVLRTQHHVGEHEPLSLHDFSYIHGNRRAEHWAIGDDGMELAPLAARVYAVGKVVEEHSVIRPAGERRFEVLRVDHGDGGLHAVGEHLPGQLGGIPTP